jgi:hypothetical protein
VSVALALIAHLYLWTRPRPEAGAQAAAGAQREHARGRRTRPPHANGGAPPHRGFVPVPAVLEEVRLRLAEARAEGRHLSGREIGRLIGRHEATARKYLRYVREEEGRFEPEPAETVA